MKPEAPLGRKYDWILFVVFFVSAAFIVSIVKGCT